MADRMNVSRPKFLELARRLALVSAPGLVACGGSSAASSGASTAPAPSTSQTSQAQSDPTAGDGPCRCSWETNASLAPRVCKKGEIDHKGEPCVRGAEHDYGPTSEGGSYYPPPVPGPLPPPDLPTA